jgi:hypothetical protein
VDDPAETVRKKYDKTAILWFLGAGLVLGKDEDGAISWLTNHGAVGKKMSFDGVEGDDPVNVSIFQVIR